MPDLETYLSQIDQAVAGIRALPTDETPSPSNPTTHTVKSGDTLRGIAALYPPLTWEQLAAYNGLASPYTISPGQVLRLTAPETPPVVTPPDPDPGTPTQPSRPVSAGDKRGWGNPILFDDFNGTKLDTTKWNVPGEPWPANDTVKAGRWASHNTVQDGYLRQTGTSDGKTGWVASKLGQKYGRWEACVRIITKKPGKAFHPVLILWPDSDKWPAGAEYDFLEINSDSKRAGAFLHYPNHKPKVQEEAVGPALDFSEWHNFAIEWTDKALTGFLDGDQWFKYDKDGIQNAPGPMHLTIQLDNFVGTSGLAEVYFDVDWVKVWKI